MLPLHGRGAGPGITSYNYPRQSQRWFVLHSGNDEGRPVPLVLCPHLLSICACLIGCDNVEYLRCVPLRRLVPSPRCVRPRHVQLHRVLPNLTRSILIEVSRSDKGWLRNEVMELCSVAGKRAEEPFQQIVVEWLSVWKSGLASQHNIGKGFILPV